MAVQGTVVDSSGEPVIGANVIVRGSSAGVATDLDGRFRLDVVPDATLVVSYLGYNTQEVPVNNRSQITIVLQENAADFEVQVLMDAVNDARVSDARLGALVSFGLFDLYRPKTDEGDAEKSLAFAVELNSTGEEALTDAEADATMQALVEVLERAGARLRA